MNTQPDMRYIGMVFTFPARMGRGYLNVAEWLWLDAHAGVSLGLHDPPCVHGSCVWWNEL